MTAFCIDCGASLRPNVKFCTKCGAKTSGDNVTVDGSVPVTSDAAPSFSQRFLPRILGAVAVLVVAVVGGTYFFGKPIVETNGCDPASIAAGADCTVATATDVAAATTGQLVQMFVVADANVRDRATARGSNILQKFLRGAPVLGIMQIGEDGTSQWLRLHGDAGFIGAVNLSLSEPPKLVFATEGSERVSPVNCQLRAAPMADAAIMTIVPAGTKLVEVGSTEGDFWEYKLPMGGVGYTFRDISQCGSLAVDSNVTNGFSTVMNDNMFRSEFESVIADQNILIGFNVDAFSPPLQAAAYASYENKVTNKICSSFLHLMSKNGDGSFLFRQTPRPGETACSLSPTVTLRSVGAIDQDNGVEQISVRWNDQATGKLLMSGSLWQVGD